MTWPDVDTHDLLSEPEPSNTLLNMHPRLVVTDSRSTPDKCSVRPVLSDGAPDFSGSVRDVLTSNFDRGTVVRLVPEDEYQALMALAIEHGLEEALDGDTHAEAEEGQ